MKNLRYNLDDPINTCHLVAMVAGLAVAGLSQSAMAQWVMPPSVATQWRTVDHVKFEKPVYNGHWLDMVHSKVPLGPAKTYMENDQNPIKVMNYVEFYFSPSYMGTISRLSFSEGPRDDWRYSTIWRKMDITVIREDGTKFRVQGIPNGYHAAEDERRLIGRKLVLPYEVWIMRHTALFD